MASKDPRILTTAKDANNATVAGKKVRTSGGARQNLGKSQSKAVTEVGGASGTTAEVTVLPPPPAMGSAFSSPTDAYRSGAPGIPGLTNPRTLGEVEQETLAHISITSGGTSINSAGPVVEEYSRFFLQAVTETQTEKYQVVETFTASYAFFYGKRPSMYNFRGMLLNDANHRWASDFLFYYENYFRGTRSAELNAEAVIVYDERQVSGFILDLSLQQTSDIDRGVSFSMNMLVTDHKQLKYSADVSQLIESASKSLRLEKENLARYMASVNRQIPSGIYQNTVQAVNGAQPLSGFRLGVGPGALPDSPPVNLSKKLTVV